jgi:ABC-type nitrate/sulfonate/bicarbonate transport system substrate-binding protein
MRLSAVLAAVIALVSACAPAATPAAPTAAAKPTAAAAQPTVAPTAAAAATATAVPKPAPTTVPTPAPASLTMGFSNIAGGELAVWYAVDKGAFSSRNLQVDAQLVAGGANTMAALLAGQLQIADAGGSEALSAVASGADLVVVATLSPVYPYVFEVVPEIQTTQDLIGKKIGVATLGGSADIATRVALRQAGLDPNKDVTIVATGSAQNRTAALASGAIQGGMVGGPPETLELEARGLHPLMDLAALKLPTANTSLVVQRSWLEANRPILQRYVDGLVEASARLKKDKPGATAVLKNYFKSDDDAAMSASYDFFAGEVIPALPYPRPEHLKDAVEQLGATNPKVLEVSLDKLLDPSFVQSAADRKVGE